MMAMVKEGREELEPTTVQSVVLAKSSCLGIQDNHKSEKTLLN